MTALVSTVAADLYSEADLYCAAFSWPLDDEVDWLLPLIQRMIGGPVRNVLEPFCGSARYGPVLAARGAAYWGIDLSAGMLARAPRGDRIHLICADAREFRIPEAPPAGFDLAWCPVNSVRHLLSDEDIVAHLTCVRRHLTGDGCYALELELSTHDGPGMTDPPPKSRWSMEQPDGSIVHAEWNRERSDLGRRLCWERASLALEHDGRVLRQLSQLFTMRQWTLDHLVRCTSAGGFAVERVFQCRASAGWPEVALGEALHDTESNHLFLLRAM